MGNTVIDLQTIDLERMSKEIGLPVHFIRRVLGYRSPEEVVCLAASVDEAKRIYHEAPAGGSMERAAFFRWVELATTVDELKEACEAAMHDGEEERVAMAKLATFFLWQ